MDFRYYFDCSKSIRDYDYTHRSVQNMKRLVSTERFQNADAETIFHYITNETEIVIFNDYLKRYLYKRSAIQKPFYEVSDNEYKKIISSSFAETQTPHSFVPNSLRRWSNILKTWLNAKAVPRDTVFLLGFGLHMPPGDVSEFLVKVLKTDDFNFSDEWEVILWYCYKMGLPYLKAKSLMIHLNDQTYNIQHNATIIHNVNEIKTEEQLYSYLLQTDRIDTNAQHREVAYSTFMHLLDKTKNIISQIYNTPDNANPHYSYTNKTITLATVENFLNSGVPYIKENLFSSERSSLLYPFIQNARLTRQRLWSIQYKRYPVRRNDLILLQFFIFSYEMRNAEPCDRFRSFVDSMNNILKSCGMLELYPVNPFESFVLLCLLSDEPFELYTDAIEYSYAEV